MGVEPAAAGVRCMDHRYVDSWSCAVPASLCLSSEENHGSQSWEEGEQFQERRAGLVKISRRDLPDAVSVPEVPRDDIRRDELAAIDAGLAQDAPHVLGRGVVVV